MVAQKTSPSTLSISFGVQNSSVVSQPFTCSSGLRIILPKTSSHKNSDLNSVFTGLKF